MSDILPSNDAVPFIDHTCVTPFERFAHSVERHLRAWKISTYSEACAPPPPSASSSSPGKQRSSTVIRSADVAFQGKKMALELRNVSDPKPDNGLNGAALERFLGVLTCIYLSPASGMDSTVAKDACEASVLLSAMVMAAVESGCKLPVVVPIGDDMDFLGRNPYYNIRYACGSVPYPPPGVSHAAGLLELFAAKRHASRPLHFLQEDYNSMLVGNKQIGHVYITACFHYAWKSFPLLLNAAPPNSFMADKYLEYTQSELLTENDPMRDIEIKAIWHRFAASSMGNDPFQWSFPPMNADVWCLRANFRDSSYEINSRYPLTRRLSSMRHLAGLARRTYKDSCAAPIAFVDVGADHSQFLEAAHNYIVDWNVEHVQGVDEIFFIAALGSLLFRDSMVQAKRVTEALGPEPGKLDSAQRLARFASTMNGRARVFRKMWAMYLDGVTTCWESKTKIPCLADDRIDLHSVLLRQKLQMINCCIARRARVKGTDLNNNSSEGMPEIISWDNSWDCDWEEEKSDNPEADGSKPSAERRTEADECAHTEMNENASLGRKKLIPNTYLVGCSEKGTKIPVYEPELQEHPLVTSDIAARMSDELSDPSLSHTDRARIQSASLTSDMSAFKAANKEASLIDFIRWFSPSDHAEDVTETQKNDCDLEQFLSERMRTPGNLWEELWEKAPAVPAHKQKPLFNPIESGLKALGDLRSMSLSQVIEELTILLVSEIVSVLTNAMQKPPVMKPILKELSRARLLTDSAVLDSRCTDELIESVVWCEKVILRATALTKRIPIVQVDDVADGESNERAKIIGVMCTGAEAKVHDLQQRRAIGVMAGLSDTDSEKEEGNVRINGRWRYPLLPHAREFVFEAQGRQNGGDNSFTSPDRMYARNEEDRFTVGLRLSLDYET